MQSGAREIAVRFGNFTCELKFIDALQFFGARTPTPTPTLTHTDMHFLAQSIPGTACHPLTSTNLTLAKMLKN